MSETTVPTSIFMTLTQTTIVTTVTEVTEVTNSNIKGFVVFGITIGSIIMLLLLCNLCKIISESRYCNDTYNSRDTICECFYKFCVFSRDNICECCKKNCGYCKCKKDIIPDETGDFVAIEVISIQPEEAVPQYMVHIDRYVSVNVNVNVFTIYPPPEFELPDYNLEFELPEYHDGLQPPAYN